MMTIVLDESHEFFYLGNCELFEILEPSKSLSATKHLLLK